MRQDPAHIPTRLRAAVGPYVADGFDVDAHLESVASQIDRVRRSTDWRGVRPAPPAFDTGQMLDDLRRDLRRVTAQT